jgi:RimJ/RimL family protein N-acetyltransferase
MTILATDRLILRAFCESDLDAYAAMLADPDVVRFLGTQPLTRSEAWRNLAMVLGHWTLRGYGLWAVEDRESGLLAGRVGLWRPEGWPALEVGWTLRRQFWGRGFATEAAHAVIEYAFSTLGQNHLISLIHPENVRSIAVASRLGMTHEGRTELLGNEVVIYGTSAREK